MFRLLRKTGWIGLLLLFFILGLTVLQVYLSVELMTDFTREMGTYYSKADAAMAVDAKEVWMTALYLVLTALAIIVTQVAVSFCAAQISVIFSKRVRKDLYHQVSILSASEIKRFSTASLVTRATNDIDRIMWAILLMLRMAFSAPITAVWAIAKVSASSLDLTWIIVVGVSIIVVGLISLFLLVLPKFRVAQKFIDRLNLITRENLTGIRVIRAYNAEDYQEEKFEKANVDLMKLNLFTSRILGLMNPFLNLVLNGIVLGVYALGAKLMHDGTMDYGSVMAFATLSTQIVFAFMILLIMMINLPRAFVSAARLNEVLRTNPSIIDPAEPKHSLTSGEVEFVDVSFAYPGSDEPIFEHVSFHAKQGQTIAVIGATGSGKTTLVNLLPRLYDVTSGSVLVDGVDVRELSQAELRSKIGFVPQKGILFRGSVAFNIGFGRPETVMDEVREAAKIACADGFIAEMPEGYESPITQGGTNVSGGQRQRLCIARAAAIQPEIFVFDDAFSALDFKTDKTVRGNLASSFPNATKIIVAQRVGTIMDADQILVLSEGKVVGQGNHKELLKDCPEYRDIALSQLSKEELGL